MNTKRVEETVPKSTERKCNLNVHVTCVKGGFYSDDNVAVRKVSIHRLKKYSVSAAK